MQSLPRGQHLPLLGFLRDPDGEPRKFLEKLVVSVPPCQFSNRGRVEVKIRSGQVNCHKFQRMLSGVDLVK
jgi:hypothetical protein